MPFRPCRTLAMALVLLAAPAVAAERLSTVPDRFRGIWMAEAQHCSAAATDESWLRLDAEAISFYESGGPHLAIVGESPVRAAQQADPDTLVLVSQLGGEGTTWLDLRELTLSPDGRGLTMRMVGVEGAVQRVRCP